MSLVSQIWAINACLCRLPVDPRNARQQSADICDLSCCSQYSALTWLTLITWRVINKCPVPLQSYTMRHAVVICRTWC